jgi:DNA-binding beta-propeller fold protein YncE
MKRVHGQAAVAAALAVVFGLTALATASPVVIHPDWQQPELYYQSDDLIPAQLNWGFDDNLYVGSAVALETRIHRVTGPGTGAPYGDVLSDPDAVMHTADGSVFVGGFQDVWRIPPGPGTPELIIDDGFPNLNLPGHFALAPNGDLLAQSADSILRVNLDGTLTTVVENIDAPRGIAFGPDGYLYYVSRGQTSVSRVMYDAGALPIDDATVDPYLTGFDGLNNLGLLNGETVLLQSELQDELWFGYLDGTSEVLALVPAEVMGPLHQFNAVQGPDGAIYLADGPNGTEAIYRIPFVPEPTSVGLLAVGALAMLRRRRDV